MQDVLTMARTARVDIEKRGYAVVFNEVSTTDGWLQANHTLGLAKQGLPELVEFGLGEELGKRILHDLAQLQISQGPFTEGREIKDEIFHDGGDYSFMMVQIELQYIDDIFGLNKFLFGPEFVTTGMQVAYPDSKRRWPWDKDSELGEMPRLGRRPV